MTNKRGVTALLASLLLAGAVAFAQPQRISDHLVVHKLPNGMIVQVYPRPGSSTFTAVMQFDTGGSDEIPGTTGIAHMFEHMAFKGTQTIGTKDYAAEVPILEQMDKVVEEINAERSRLQPPPNPEHLKELREKLRGLQKEQSQYIVKDEFDAILQQEGARGINASTNSDFTTYHMSLPTNKLELWFWMEADRIMNPVLREFYSERDVVVEERRMRTDNDPDGKAGEVFQSLLFDATPYRQPVIGWPTDVMNLTTEMSRQFRAAHYGPSGVVVTIVGDVDPAQVIAFSDKYFAAWQSTGKPQRIPTKDPIRTGERTALVEFDAEPTVMIGWNKPGIPTRDDVVFEVLDRILTSGKTSRLYQNLVKKQGLAVDVGSGNIGGRKYDNAFTIAAEPRAPHTLEELDEAIMKEVADVAEHGVSDKELERVKGAIEANFVRRMRSNMGLAFQLTSSTDLYKDPGAIDRHRDELRSVTAAEIKEVAAKYLTRSKRVVVKRVRPSQETLAAEAKEAAEKGPGPGNGPRRGKGKPGSGKDKQ